MSRTAVILALLLAAALSVASAFLLTRGGTPPPTLVAPFDPAAILSVSLASPGGPSRTIAPAPDPSADPAPLLTLRNPDGSTYARRVDPARYAAALRALAAAKSLGPGAPPDPQSAHTLELRSTSSSVKLLIAPSPLAGRLAVSLVSPGGPVSLAAPADAFSFFTGDPADILDPAVFRWPNEPVAIRLSRGGESKPETLAFERTGRLWRLTAPFDAPADRPAVANLQAALSNLRLRTAGPAPAGLSAPASAIVRIAFTAGPDPSPDLQALQITGKSGDLDAIYSGPSGSCSLVLKDADLAHLFDDTASFVAKQSLERPSGDILALLVRTPGDGLGNPRTFRRSADTWSDGIAPLTPGDARLLTNLLETLANSPAAAVLLAPPADFESIASLTALGLSDANLGDLSVGTATSPAAAAAGRTRKILCVTRGPIARLYPVEADDPLLAWLRTIVP